MSASKNLIKSANQTLLIGTSEAVPFPHFKYYELAAEDAWEDSELYGMLPSHFLFIFLRKMGEGKDPIFEKPFIHSLSVTDLDEAKVAWKLAVDKARVHLFEEMPGQKANRVIHVRPHDSKASYGKDHSIEKHRCFWLNQAYI